MNIEGEEIETYKTFVVLLYNTKLTEKIDLPKCNNLVPPNKKKV